MNNRDERQMKILLWSLIAAMILVALAQQCNAADLTFAFHRQPDEGKHSPWYLCIRNNDPSSAVRVTLADIYAAASGKVALYDPARVAQSIHFKRRNRIIRALAITSQVTSLLQGAELIRIGEIWGRAIAPAVAGGTAIAIPALETNARAEAGIEAYWLTDRTLAGGEASCGRVMSSRNAAPNTASFSVRSAASAPDAGPSALLRTRPLALEVVGPPALPSPLISMAASAAACIVRPSSVEDEGCGSWYG